MCVSPVYKMINNRWQPLQCGGCPDCKRRRIDAWVFRMLQEEKRSISAHFITLTYDTAHVPISPNGYMTLTKGYDLVKRKKPTKKGNWYKKKDRCCFTKFMKRLRKISSDDNIKYYACGEYGEDKSRPHWHAIVFNVSDDNAYKKAWSLDGCLIGRVDVGTVTDKSIAYTCGYINKRKFATKHARDDRVPEFSLMSKGLGENFVTPATKRYYSADLSRMYLTKDGGDRIAMPRYYRNRILDEDQRAMQGSIVELAIGKSNSEDYERYLQHYGQNNQLTYSEYVQRIRESKVQSFYSQSKKRNYD